jgi:hypothetical protein
LMIDDVNKEAQAQASEQPEARAMSNITQMNKMKLDRTIFFALLLH